MFLTQHTASSCVLAWVPLPRIATWEESSLARRSVAAPLPAPVRLAVRTSPSIKAESAPVVASKTVTTAWIRGRLRFGLFPKTETILTASFFCSGRAAGIAKKTASCSGRLMRVRRGILARPEESSRNAVFISSISDFISSAWDISSAPSTLISMSKVRTFWFVVSEDSLPCNIKGFADFFSEKLTVWKISG